MPHGAIEDHERRREIECLDHTLVRALDVEHLPDRVAHPLARERELVAQVRLVRTAHVVVHELGVEPCPGLKKPLASIAATSVLGSRSTTIASSVGARISHSPGDQRFTSPKSRNVTLPSWWNL